LVEYKEDRSIDRNPDLDSLDSMSRVDSMKINSIEIIISFQQSIHVPVQNIFRFLIDEQRPHFTILGNLVSHLMYSSDQGLMVQIAEFLKLILDRDNS
jgi:hypothetical protein